MELATLRAASAQGDFDKRQQENMWQQRLLDEGKRKRERVPCSCGAFTQIVSRDPLNWYTSRSKFYHYFEILMSFADAVSSMRLLLKLFYPTT